MTSDLNLYRLHHVDGLSYIDIAAKYELDPDSVRGRISRVSLADRMRLMEDIATKAPLENTFLAKQREIIARSEAEFESRQETLQIYDGEAPYTAVFVSDLHLPYTDWKAAQLALEIISDLQPDFVSAFVNCRTPCCSIAAIKS